VFNLFKIALCQSNVVDNKGKNLDNAYKLISEAASNGADMVALCEMFNCPYSGKYFSNYGERVADSQTIGMLKAAAVENSIYLIGGSIPEIEEDEIYNTSYVINSEGEVIARHRKTHLFDVNIENGIRFMESEYLSPGEDITVFDTPFGKAGLCICYDIRFPEMIRSLVLKGAQIIFIPAAFNMTTGPAHWETLFKARALDNQVYMAGISPAREENGVYTAYGHSIITNPWGQIMEKANEGQEIIYGDIDIDYENKIREELPLLKHRKPEIYINR
jgi:predicted amidohydrolase